MPDWEKLLTEPLPTRLRNILELAEENGWNPNPITLVARMSQSPFHPFYIRWAYDMASGKYSFDQAKASKIVPATVVNGKLKSPAGYQRLTLKDVGLYIQNPEVLMEEKKIVSAWEQ